MDGWHGSLIHYGSLFSLVTWRGKNLRKYPSFRFRTNSPNERAKWKNEPTKKVTELSQDIFPPSSSHHTFVLIPFHKLLARLAIYIGWRKTQLDSNWIITKPAPNDWNKHAVREILTPAHTGWEQWPLYYILTSGLATTKYFVSKSQEFRPKFLIGLVKSGDKSNY